MSNVIRIAFRRGAPTHSTALSHPAGVEFPKGKVSGADMFIPEIKDAIHDGTYRSDPMDRSETSPRGVRRRPGVVVVSNIDARSVYVSPLR